MKSERYLLLVWMILNHAFDSDLRFVTDRCVGDGIHCHCDDQCELYGDCCDRRSALNSSERITSCRGGIFVIDKCKGSGVSQVLREYCENETTFSKDNLVFHTPVYTNQSYKNMFCAICNDQWNYRFAELRCQKVAKRDGKVDSCPLMKNLKFRVPTEVSRVCPEIMKDSCPRRSDKVFKELCLSEPTFYFTHFHAVYRNVYCFVCNLATRAKFRSRFVLDSKVIDFNTWCSKDCQIRVEEYRKKKENNASSRTLVQENSTMYRNVVLVVFRITSMISLCFLLVVYGSIKEMKNSPGKVTMLLTFSLLLLTLTNTLFLITSERSFVFCFVMSILLQYFFLSSFFWLSIFAFDIHQSLTSNHVNQVTGNLQNQKRKLRLYVFVGFGSPILFCGSAILSQFLDENNILNAGFGEPECFINRLVGGLVWVFIPLCTCITFNLVLCGFLFTFLYKSSVNSSVSGRNVNMKMEMIVLCIKVSVLFGVAWVPGFVGVFINNETLKIVGGFCSSLHGVLVSLSFISGINVRRAAYAFMSPANTTTNLTTEAIRRKSRAY